MPPNLKRRRTGKGTGVTAESLLVEPTRELSAGLRKWEAPVRGKFDFETITSDLDRNGLCVIGDILTSEERTEFESSFWEALVKRSPDLDQHDPATWQPEYYAWKGNAGAGQYKHYGMAQEKHCWLIRKNKVIRDIFEKAIFNEECCVSLDGAAALFAPSISKLPLHVDLVPDLPGSDFGSIQGAYNLYEVSTDGDRCGACFVCVVGSHKEYDSVWAAAQSKPGFKHPTKHWLVIDSDSPFQQQAVQVISPANSLTIWRSELLHKNYGGDLTAAELGRMCRLVQFVAWQPKRHRSENTRLRKIQLVKDGVCGNHWAALCERVTIRPFPPWGKHTTPIVLPFNPKEELPPEIEELL